MAEDSAVKKTNQESTVHTLPDGPPGGGNVISFSLWGPAPFYSTVR